MKPRIVAGGLLMVLGVAALATGGLEYGRERHEVEMGPLRMQVQQRKRLEVPPLVAGLMLAGGVALVLLDLRRGR